MRHCQEWTPNEIALLNRLRRSFKPAIIAKMIGRTETAVNRMLSIQKKNGVIHPKLEHGNTKYTTLTVDNWRERVGAGAKYRELGVHPVTVSRKFKEQLYRDMTA